MTSPVTISFIPWTSTHATDPETCTSTHARDLSEHTQQRMGTHHHWCPLWLSSIFYSFFGTTDFSWHCIEIFLDLLFLLYDGDNIGFRQKRLPALMTTTRCATRSKTSLLRLERSMWSASFVMRSSRRVASRSASRCSNA